MPNNDEEMHFTQYTVIPNNMTSKLNASLSPLRMWKQSHPLVLYLLLSFKYSSNFTEMDHIYTREHHLNNILNRVEWAVPPNHVTILSLPNLGLKFILAKRVLNGGINGRDEH